jgi:hypothetical protein
MKKSALESSWEVRKKIRSQMMGRREIVEKFRWNRIKTDINRQALDVFEDISNGNKKKIDFGEF